jgi:hypothetical protein
MGTIHDPYSFEVGNETRPFENKVQLSLSVYSYY